MNQGHHPNLQRVLPRVIIDARMIGSVPHGIARYVMFLAEGLRLLHEPLQYEPIFLVSPNAAPQYLAKLRPFNTLKIKSPFLNPKELLEIPQTLKDLGASLYHSPSFSSLFSCPCPSVVTIHDLNHLIFGSWTQKLYYQLLLKRFARSSKAIVTVSEFSRREISQWLGIEPWEIQMVSNSVTATPVHGIDSVLLNQFGLTPKKYFFCLSNSKPHKNLPFLLKAYERFRNQYPQAWPLVLLGSKDQFKECLTAGVIWIGHQPDSTIQTLLEQAGGNLFPSLYEGFGLPPVEAALCGAPLAVSQIPAHQEGLVDLSPNEVTWVDPQDLSGWVKSFETLFQSEANGVSSLSRERILKRFHPHHMGLRMNQIYLSALGLERVT